MKQHIRADRADEMNPARIAIICRNVICLLNELKG